MSVEHPILATTARPPDRTVVTGPEQSDVYDVWEPGADRADRPERGLTIALVHGGFWRAEYDRSHLAPLASALADDGYHVANLEYPRIGMPHGGFPGTLTGGGDQVAALADDGRLPQQVLAVGHSAGGHLALWLASQPLRPEGSRPDNLAGVISLAPAADLAEVDRLFLSKNAARALLGSAPDEDPDAWATADPARHTIQVPTVVVSASEDDLVPGSVTAAYRDTRRPEENVTFTEINGGHYDLIDPSHEAYLTLLAHLEQLVLDLR